jgi:hypothetical protein
MRPRITHIIAAALVLVVCRATFEPTGARVTRDDKGTPANPAIEAGGHHLTNKNAAAIPYSFIGAISSESNPVGSCSIGSWRRLEALVLHRHGIRGRAIVRRISTIPINRRFR